jgi:hypothetical protein
VFRYQVCIIVVLSLQAIGFAAPTGVKTAHLEELMIWKVSDELQLKSTEEKAFSQTVKNLNQEKAQLSEQLQQNLTSLQNEKSEKKIQDILKKYRQTLVAYSKLNEKEFDEMLKLLGTQRMSQYLLLKQEITQKIKGLLSAPAEDSKPALPPPKIIEDGK